MGGRFQDYWNYSLLKRQFFDTRCNDLTMLSSVCYKANVLIELPKGLAMSGINITVYKWAGAWGPFKVNIPCGECTLTEDVIKDTLANELKDVDVELETHDWLTQSWKPLLKGGWHAPIVMVNGRVVSQGEALNRGLLTQVVTQEDAKNRAVKGTRVFGKAHCPHCIRVKSVLDTAGISHVYHDVVKDPKAMYEMLGRVKAIIGEKTPVTVPQVWIDGEYVGGADAVQAFLGVEPDEERHQNRHVKAAA